MYPPTMREEELKNKVAKDFFANFDSTKINDNIDFWICPKNNFFTQSASYLWAEAKRGNKEDIIESFVQLILTIGRKRLQNIFSPPSFLGAFDCEKIAFVPYNSIMHIFAQSDFNWNVRPSDHSTKEFQQLYTESKSTIESQSLLFHFATDSKHLKTFIKTNFILENVRINRQKVDKNNFVNVYLRWQEEVKDCINVNWESLAKEYKILDSDFYLADLLSSENKTLTQKLQVILQKEHYELLRGRNDAGLFSGARAEFKENLKDKHTQFWNRYERPPKEEYWDYIIERRDLLVPQNLREYQGAFFTPRIWVEKSQEYLAKTLGENYQDEYYIWDCAAGTGNLLVGLNDKYKIYASTLHKSDVDVMIQRIQRANLNLLESNVFVFDFLNDALPCVLHKEKQDSCFNCKNFDENTSKIPKSLINILKDSKKREKLIIYINPPYAEAASATTATQKAKLEKINKNKTNVSNETMVFQKYIELLGKGARELFTQFFFRIYNEIPHCNLAAFSKLKYINSSNFIKFRETFKARFLGGFVCPAYTFDNVNGNFPIGFLMWNLSKDKTIQKTISLDVYNDSGEYAVKKNFYTYEDKLYIIEWLRKYYDKNTQQLAYLRMQGTDFSHNRGCFIATKLSDNDFKKHLFTIITQHNLIPFSVYFSVRHATKATWLNDRDQFLYPHDSWESDAEFQNDCLAFTLFHGQNRISSKADSTNQHTNHFIPFRESEVDSREAFESHFMSDFIGGKMARDVSRPLNMTEGGQHDASRHSEALAEESQNTESKTKKPQELDLFETESKFIPTKPLVFSNEAKAVFEAGKALYRYYHANFGKIPEIHHDDEFYRIYQANASLYDIKGYFQGFKNGRMNARSLDSVYNDLMANLRYALEKLAKKIEPKIYEYGFLLE